MVRQLEENGEAVDYLALIDSPPPLKNTADTVFEFTPESEVSWLSDYLPDEDLKEAIKKLPDIHAIWSTILDYFEESDFDPEVVKRAIPGNLVKMIPNVDQLNIRQLVMYLNIIRSLDRARSIYLPPAKVKAPVYFVGASESKRVKKEEWNQYTEVPATFDEVPGDHFSILRTPQVKNLARIFKNLEDKPVPQP
jgi:thioesterase domain-containing protein